MIRPAVFFSELQQNEIDFFTGVPDSLLKHFCAYITANTDKKSHILAANEGNAIALATGYNLSTDKYALVYMQNSGLGNSVNPLTSLTHEKVYQIPMLLLVGWRGEPGKPDACQHLKQGEITPALLEILDIPYTILDKNTNIKEVVGTAKEHMDKAGTPYALIAKKGVFEDYNLELKEENYELNMSREEAIERVITSLSNEDIIVSNTGKISREVYEVRERLNHSHKNDFLMVGSLGHASQIALTIAAQKPDKQIYCFDGDGGALMHLGSLAINAASNLKNFNHIVFNNGAHDSVGGQPTIAFDIDFLKVAEGLGYNRSYRTKTKKDLEENIDILTKFNGPLLFEIQVRKGARDDLGRPDIDAKTRKNMFKDNLMSRGNI